MAALCGSSNALSSLQKHATADRSHQQDRFQRPAPSSLQGQGLRSGPSVQGRWLDNEFENFLEAPALHHHSSLNADQLQSHSWANDFQRLDIRGAQQQFHAPGFAPGFAQQQQQPQWGQEFAQRLQQREGLRSIPQQQQQQSFSTAMEGYMGEYGPAFSPQLDLSMAQTQPMMQSLEPEFQFDESAFEKAFADAAREVEVPQESETDHRTVAEVQPEPVAEKEPFVKDSDDLARTAGQLLDSVHENTSQKFQNSNFLALMRKLRDHEVVVQGDKMVETR